jgi:hypothetical protein
MSINQSIIIDSRTSTAFKGISFSGFKKTEVHKQFVENMKKGRVEPACYWCAELLCAGHILDIWETIIHFMSKYIHIGNPKMPIYIDMRYNIFKNIMAQSSFLNELEVRNNSTIRKMFAELVCNLSLSNRKPSFETIKINRVEEFDITQMTERLKADSPDYSREILKPKDPQELTIAVNELAFNLQPTKQNMARACYWIEWIMEFDTICKKRKQPILCEERFYPVDLKYRRDIIWIIWDTLFHQLKPNPASLNKKIMDALLNIFCIRYTATTSKKRKYLLYHAVEIITEHMQPNIELIADKKVLESVVEQIDHVYKQIKKNEVHSHTDDYLFDGLEIEMKMNHMINKMNTLDNFEAL